MEANISTAASQDCCPKNDWRNKLKIPAKKLLQKSKVKVLDLLRIRTLKKKQQNERNYSQRPIIKNPQETRGVIKNQSLRERSFR